MQNQANNQKVGLNNISPEIMFNKKPSQENNVENLKLQQRKDDNTYPKNVLLLENNNGNSGSNAYEAIISENYDNTLEMAPNHRMQETIPYNAKFSYNLPKKDSEQIKSNQVDTKSQITNNNNLYYQQEEYTGYNQCNYQNYYNYDNYQYDQNAYNYYDGQNNNYQNYDYNYGNNYQQNSAQQFNNTNNFSQMQYPSHNYYNYATPQPGYQQYNANYYPQNYNQMPPQQNNANQGQMNNDEYYKNTQDSNTNSQFVYQNNEITDSASCQRK